MKLSERLAQDAGAEGWSGCAPRTCQNPDGTGTPYACGKRAFVRGIAAEVLDFDTYCLCDDGYVVDEAVPWGGCILAGRLLTVAPRVTEDRRRAPFVST